LLTLRIVGCRDYIYEFHFYIGKKSGRIFDLLVMILKHVYFLSLVEINEGLDYKSVWKNPKESNTVARINNDKHFMGAHNI